MKVLRQSFKVEYNYAVFFAENIFDQDNNILVELIANDEKSGLHDCLIVVDQGVYDTHSNLFEQIKIYFKANRNLLKLVKDPILVPGGEIAKNDNNLVKNLLKQINDSGLCRHSYIIAIGGGAVLDLVGYVAAIAHRGIRHIRIPTTVLSQNDSGIGVKNGINSFGKKNFTGTFSPPFAVINDYHFLYTLNDRDWRSGIAEAVKVALIKNLEFFEWIENNAAKLVDRNMATMQELIYTCAQLHLDHIASGDPFELGSSRPLDFGHWASHKLEHLTNYELRHGEAVAIGIALDSTYSHMSGMISQDDLSRIVHLLLQLGFTIYTPELASEHNTSEDNILSGLEEFRQHLGGELTVMLLSELGIGVEVNHMDQDRITTSIKLLSSYQPEKTSY